ncbi:MAG: family 20 glycosylhydrolase [Ferruginibacter sp.]
MKQLVLFYFIIMALSASAQNNVNIVPMPAEVKLGTGNFVISPSTKIILEGSNLEKTAQFLNNYLQKNYGFSLKIQKENVTANAIILNYERMDMPIAGAYLMNITKEEIYIAGDNEAGAFYGMQTLLQLLPVSQNVQSLKNNIQLSIPQLAIKDYPRFAYRGMHLDVARHFFPVSFIKKYIDYLAAYKFNRFHWHLTDDQGWRIEIKKYPLLTKVGGYRNGTIIGRYPGTGNDSLNYGGFYTQAQIKEVVKYAADRYIDVIPEIEMPGHASAAIAAYPQLSCFPDEDTPYPAKCVWAGPTKGKQVQQTWGVFNDVFVPTENTFKFLEDVIDEVIPLFPSKYIHVGGDECPKENWKRSAFCQQLIKDKNLKDEHGLQSYFIQRIEKYINGKGKKIIGWDEILEGGLAPYAAVMSWRGEDGGIAAAKENHDVIMTPGTYCYLDHSQTKNEDSVTIGGYLPLEKVYGYEPIPAVLNASQQKHILGAQGNLWTEYIKNENKVEYMIFPRMSALAEVLWSPKNKRNWKDFERRLPAVFNYYKSLGTNYSKAYYELEATVIAALDSNATVAWSLESKSKEEEITVTYNGPLKIFLQQQAKGILKMPISQQGIYTGLSASSKLSQQFFFNKATGKKITLVNEPSKSYPGNGAFTLVDGVQNEKGLAKSIEFLGFNGTDLDATIDLGKVMEINEAVAHVLEETGSWIYRPASIEAFVSVDGITFTSAGKSDIFMQVYPLNKVSVSFQQIQTRYVRVLIKNSGVIPAGSAGAGEKAWLFVDEIEVK